MHSQLSIFAFDKHFSSSLPYLTPRHSQTTEAQLKYYKIIIISKASSAEVFIFNLQNLMFSSDMDINNSIYLSHDIVYMEINQVLHSIRVKYQRD